MGFDWTGGGEREGERLQCWVSRGVERESGGEAVRVRGSGVDGEGLRRGENDGGSHGRGKRQGLAI